MIKTLIPALAALTLTTQVMANEMTHEEHAHEKSNLYVVAKAMYILGDDIQESTETLTGDSGMGFGIDFGYRIAEGFAVEYDFSYSANTVHLENISADADYTTHALDLVYTYEATEDLGVFVKAGYEYESESIEDETSSDTGAVFGVGCEYSLSHQYAIVGEYEHSLIDGPRGDSIFLGALFNF